MSGGNLHHLLSVYRNVLKTNAMETVYVKIDKTTPRGKYLAGLLREMSKEGNDISFVRSPSVKKAGQKKPAGLKVNVEEAPDSFMEQMRI